MKNFLSIQLEWAEETKRRLEDLRTGKIAPVSGEEVFNKILNRFEK